jgi:citrate lyase subunit beta / citryl-CoA lyase
MTVRTQRPRRSALYMPASNAKAIEKAKALPCDVVILDLEDAVAPEAKEVARKQATEAVKAGGFARRELVIRVNGLDSPWGEADVRAAIAAQPQAILAPKISSAQDIAHYQQILAPAGDQVELWAMIETTRSLFHLYEIAMAATSSRLACLVMGTNDLAKETGARLIAGRAPLQTALALGVAAGKLAQLTVLDGVYNDLENEDGFRAECVQGLDFGFDGKTLIHPRQIEMCNKVFTPDAEQIASAKAIVAAFALPENATRGALRVNGKMVERLHLQQAERLLSMAAAATDQS